jgi:hypothetical protein
VFGPTIVAAALNAVMLFPIGIIFPRSRTKFDWSENLNQLTSRRTISLRRLH